MVGKTLLCFRVAEIVPDEIYQIRRVLAILDRESGRKADRFGIFAQKPSPDRVERARPRYRVRYHRVRDRAAAVPRDTSHDAADTARHFD